MKTIYVHLVIAIILVPLPVIGCLLPVAKAQSPDSWVDMGVTSFNGDDISFHLQVTVYGNHLTDKMWILEYSDPPSSIGISSGVSIQLWRYLQRRIYSQDTNTTVFSIDFTYSTSSSFYKVEPKFSSYLLFPADRYSLAFPMESSFNMTPSTIPTACQLPSQNYQGLFTVSQTQTSSDTFTVNLLINHSESFVLGVSVVLITTLASLYVLTAYLMLVSRKYRDNSSNIVTVSSAIIFFVPAFEIAFYGLKSPLPLVFSDVPMVFLIPLNAIVIGLSLGMPHTGLITRLRSKFSSLTQAIHKILTTLRQKS